MPILIDHVLFSLNARRATPFRNVFEVDFAHSSVQPFPVIRSLTVVPTWASPNSRSSIVAVGLLAGLTRRPMRAVELYPQLHPTMPLAAYWAPAMRPSIWFEIFVSYVKQLRCGLLGAGHLLPARLGYPKIIAPAAAHPLPTRHITHNRDIYPSFRRMRLLCNKNSYK